MSITRTGWGKPTCMKYNGRHSYKRFHTLWSTTGIMSHTKCSKCGLIVDLDEPHTKTRPYYGTCHFYHEWCYPKQDLEKGNG